MPMGDAVPTGQLLLEKCFSESARAGIDADARTASFKASYRPLPFLATIRPLRSSR